MDLFSLPIPETPGLSPGVPFLPGEAEARRRLEVFTLPRLPSRKIEVRGGPPVYGYADGRNRLDLDGTSQLSPYLRFGMLSARRAAVAAQEAIASGPDEATGGRPDLAERVDLARLLHGDPP